MANDASDIGDAPDELVEEPFPTFKSLYEAKNDPQGVIIFEGDYGGQIFLVSPAAKVGCQQKDLEKLLSDLDELAWPTMQEFEDSARIYFDKHPVGIWISGGMGGGRVTEGLWVHDEFELKGLRPLIQAVIEGRRARLNG